MKRKVLRGFAILLGSGVVFCTAFGVQSVKVFAETEYEYDDLNRLTEERHDDGTVIYYRYDSNGNLLDVEVKDGNNEKDEEPDNNSDKNPGKDQNGNFDKNQDINTGSQEGSGLGNSENDQANKRPENAENDRIVRMENGSDNAAGNNGETGTKNLTQGSQDGIGENDGESSFGQEEAGEKDAFGNNGGNKTVIAKVLTALVILTAALFGGSFIWKKRKGNEEGDGEKRE